MLGFSEAMKNEIMRIKMAYFGMCTLADPDERTIIEYSDRSLT